MAHELEPGRKLARHRGSFFEGPTGSTRARQEGRAFTRLAQPRRGARRAPTRPSFFRLDRSGGDGYGAGPSLAVKGAIGVQCPVAEHLVVLHRVVRGGLGVVERVLHADAVERHLRHAVHLGRRRDSHDIQERRRDVDDVVVLAAQLPFRLDALGPVDDQRVGVAAVMFGLL